MTNVKEIPIIYCMDSTGIAGGHRVIFEHLSRLKKRGYNVHLWALENQSAWFDLNVPLQIFPHFFAMERALETVEAIKVATWWKTADPIMNSIEKTGKGWGVYFVQDIETSYYKDNPYAIKPDFEIKKVLKTYKRDFTFITENPWVSKELKKISGSENITDVGIGIDHDLYKPNMYLKRSKSFLMCARRNPLKSFQFGVDAYRLAYKKDPTIHMRVYGTEQFVFPPNIEHIFVPLDPEVVELYQQSRAFISTSLHEGYNLTIVEAMACGCPVITTLADGNNHFCKHEENCLVVEHNDVEGLAEAILRISRDEELALQLREGGLKTAQEHQWEPVITNLEKIFKKLVGKNT